MVACPEGGHQEHRFNGVMRFFFFFGIQQMLNFGIYLWILENSHFLLL
jgi:hypothetical protein